MKGNKICCIFNIGAHYRAPIYKLIDKEFNCDFYLGNKIGSPIRLMDYHKLTGFKSVLQNVELFGNFYWQKSVLKLVFKPYRTFIITGEPYCLSTWLVLILSRILKKKTILWSHGWYGNETLIKRKVKKVFFNFSHKVLLYGNHARELMKKEGISSNKLIVIYNSLNYQNQHNVRQTLTKTNIYKSHFSNDYPVLLYIGRIQKNKKIDLLLSAINKLNKEEEPCNLVVIGKEIDNLDIKEQIKEKGLSKKVWFLGDCYNEKVLAELIFNANISVIPGDIGLAVMHSYVYGTPMITHNNFPKHGPEFEAIIDGVTGSFFMEDSLEDLCAKISYWIHISIDKKEQVRQKCFKIISEKYNPNTQINILRKVLENNLPSVKHREL